MIDAIGKPHTELMNGHFTWLGSYDECTAIEATVNISGMVSHPYTGRYCLASFEFEKVEQVSTVYVTGSRHVKISLLTCDNYIYIKLQL